MLARVWFMILLGVGQGLRQRLASWQGIVIDEIDYNYETKQKLVWNLESLVSKQKIEFSHKEQALVQSFLLIQNATTSSGRSTFTSKRKAGLGHADLFWALAHAATKFQDRGGFLDFRKKRRGSLAFQTLN